jgi:3-hydroxyisobutyrate dehydrogenase
VSAIHVGFIGLGDQGAPIAQRIASKGWPLHVWARRAETLLPFCTNAATVEPSPMSLGAACTLVCICVANDDDVRDVVLRDGQGVLYGMAPGSVIAIHSTVAPDTVVALALAACERGVHLLDAPVSGGSRGALAGTMTVMVGGDDAALEIARPIFATFATTIAHLGPVGSGQLMKLLNNNLCYANAAIAVSALELAEQLGMDPRVAAGVLKVSSGASVGLSIVTEESSLRKASGPSSNIAKDVQHFRHLLEKCGLADAALATVAATTASRVDAYAKQTLT